jgi:hypothetical protein
MLLVRQQTWYWTFGANLPPPPETSAVIEDENNGCARRS